MERGILMSLEHTTPSGKLFTWVLTFFAAVGGFLFGYDTGIISGAILKIQEHFKLTTVLQEAVVSVTVGAAALSSLLAGPACDILGRRPVLLAASVIFTVGAVVMSAARSVAMLLTGRIIIGVGVGFAAMAVPMYIAEMAPARRRGKLILTNSLFITGGMFIATVIAGALSSLPLNLGWRLMLGISGVPSTIMFIGFIFLPESPRWLVFHGHEDRARKVLSQVRGHAGVDEEMAIIMDDYREHSESHVGTKQLVKKFFTSRSVKMALLVGCSLQMFQQLCGINTIMYYTASIISMAGYNNNSAIWLSIVPSFGNFFFTLVGLLVVDRMGRRKLWFISNAGLILGLLMLIISFMIYIYFSPLATPIPGDGNSCHYLNCGLCTGNINCGFCAVYNSTSKQYSNGTCSSVAAKDLFYNHTNHLPCPLYMEYSNDSIPLTSIDTSQMGRQWFHSTCPDTFIGPLAIISLFVYLAFFAPGVGPLAWTINAEIYPTWARSAGSALSTSTNWAFNMIVSMTFLSLVSALGQPVTFALYAILTVISLLFVILFLPETRGKTLEDMEHLFQRPYFLQWCRKDEYETLKK